MARLAHSGLSSSSIDRTGPTYTTVTHQLSTLTIEILELLSKGTTSEDLFQRLSKRSDAELSTLDSDLSLYSQHKLTSNDKEARETLTAIRGISAAVKESRTPQAILTQRLLDQFQTGTTLSQVRDLLEAAPSEILSKLPPCLDRVSAGASPEGKRILDEVKELAAAIREERTPEGALTKRILALLADHSPQTAIHQALEEASSEALKGLPACLDRVIKNAPDSKGALDPIKAEIAAVLEGRTPHGTLAGKLLAAQGGREDSLKLLRDAKSATLDALGGYLDRISQTVEPVQSAAIPNIKACVDEVVESRTPLGVLAHSALAAGIGTTDGRNLLKLLKDAGTNQLIQVPNYLDKISQQLDAAQRAGLDTVKEWVDYELQNRTPDGVLASQLLDLTVRSAGGEEIRNRLNSTSTERLNLLRGHVDRIAARTPNGANGSVLHTLIADVLESRTPHGVLATQIVQAIEGCLANVKDKRGPKNARISVISAVQEASTETLHALPSYLTRVSSTMPGTQHEMKSRVIQWSCDACPAELRRRELGKPASALRLPRFPLGNTYDVWPKAVIVIVTLGVILIAYAFLRSA